jgi:hypothetical protein
VQVAVAVAGIERLDGDGDQEVALSFMANAFAARGVAHAFALMQRVGYVVGESALLEHPLVVGREEMGASQHKKQGKNSFGHRVSLIDDQRSTINAPIRLELYRH